jgi:DNA-binding transcriptional MerR regulator
LYFIKDIENITGIKAHTLRIWEQRYNLLIPKRTDTNLRYYDPADVKYILNVSILNRHGYKISRIAAMTTDEVRDKVMEISVRSTERNEVIDSLIVATYDLDEDTFNRILNNQIIRNGLEITFIEVVFPLLRRIGLLWLSDSLHPALEHFVTNIIKQKLLIAIEGQSRKLPEGKRFLLFLPEGEHHELGLLFASYLLKQKGHDVVYLGQSTPLDNLKTVFKKWQPQVLFTIITSPTLAIPATELITVIGEMWPECELWITGDKVLNNNLGSIPSNTKLVQDFSHFRQMMTNLRVSTEQ